MKRIMTKEGENDAMNKMIAYHVVTDRPMYAGQRIIFDDENHSGLYIRVMDKMSTVIDIYTNPKKYDINKIDHHTRVALRELALEEIRKEEHPDVPSRMSCLYVSESVEEAEKWAELFISWGRPTYAIVKLKVTGMIFEGDAVNCFEATLDKNENLILARRYWENLTNLKGDPPIKEILVNGELEVLEIVKVINANIKVV